MGIGVEVGVAEGIGVQAPVRFGVLEDAGPEADDAPRAHGDHGTAEHDASHDAHRPSDVDLNDEEQPESDDDDAPKSVRVGWSSVPAGKSLRLRASGLLWPEAAQRLANSAAVTRERVGNGQIILIHGEPAFRGVNHTTSRVLLNAAVFGPSLGASRPLRP